MKAARTICIFVAMAAVAVLAGCGGGSSTSEPLPDIRVNLPGGHGIPAGTYTIQAGSARAIGNVEVSCPAGGTACVLTVSSSGAVYEQSGGKPEFIGLSDELTLPDGHGIPAGTYTIQAGGARAIGNVEVSCPAGSTACVLTVSSSGAVYEQSGGRPVFIGLSDELTLPSGHGVGAATYRILPGRELTVGNVIISCPDGGDVCDLTVAADGATYDQTGGRPTVRAVLVAFDIEQHHGIGDGQDISIPSGSQHHGRHGVSLACPAGGADCVVNISGGEWWYHRTGGVPEVVIHELARAANDQDGRAASVFTRDQMSVTGGPVSRLDDSRNVAIDGIEATAMHDGTDVSFGLALDGNAPGTLRDLFAGLDSSEIDSNIPELDGWTGAALSRSDSASGLTIHANVYSDITEQADADYLVLGAWLAVPDEVTESTSLVGVLADGSDPFENSNITALTGSATYSGPAIGIYEQRTAGSSEDVRIGSFVAAAELDVDFDSARATVSGSITGFEDNGQSLGEWEVRLPDTDIAGGANRFDGSVHLTRDGGATVHEDSGAWNGSFFGDTAGDSTANPTSIAGSFEAQVGQRLTPVPNDIGYLGLVGAFGACHDSGSASGC